MSKETENPSSTVSDNAESVGIAQVQNLLQAVQLGLDGAQGKYKVLEAEFEEQKTVLDATKTENVKLKKKIIKLKEKLASQEASKEAPPVETKSSETSEPQTQWLRDVYLNSPSRLAPKMIRGKNGSSCAFVVLVMNRDAYALGAAVLAHRLKRLNTKADIVCMVTRDVSLGVVEALASEFDVVFQVPYLEYKCKKMTTKKQQQYYGNWIEQSFTKWNALALTVYKKVVLLDADLLPIRNIDHLFEMSAPAATFSSPWAKPYRKLGYDDPYKGLRHGDKVDNSKIRDAIRLSLEHSKSVENKGSYLALGSVVLLEPSMASYKIFNAFVCSQQPFGIPGCHSGFDEQSIVLFFYMQDPETKWTHISQGYNALCWHEQWIEGCDVKCYHYFNAKPWELSPDTYPDLKMWYKALHEFTLENTQSEYLTDVCITDKSFLNTYYKMTLSKAAKNSSATISNVKPALALDTISDESQPSSPVTVVFNPSKPPISRTKKSSSPISDEAADPPKIDGNKSEVLSVCSDGCKSSSSRRSYGSNRSDIRDKRSWWRDDPTRPTIKDMQSRSLANQREHRPHFMDDYATSFTKDRMRYKTSHLRPDVYSDVRLMHSFPSNRSRSKRTDFSHARAPERWMSSKGLSSSLGDGLLERHRHMPSHSPVNPRSLAKFESFGSSTSSGSYLLSPKHERRHHF